MLFLPKVLLFSFYSDVAVVNVYLEIILGKKISWKKYITRDKRFWKTVSVTNVKYIKIVSRFQAYLKIKTVLLQYTAILLLTDKHPIFLGFIYLSLCLNILLLFKNYIEFCKINGSPDLLKLYCPQLNRKIKDITHLTFVIC